MAFVTNIEKDTLKNTDYRRVIFTASTLQLVLMSVPVGEDIDLEIHPYTDQFIRVEKGFGELRIGRNQENRYRLEDGTGLIVPQNTWHRVINLGREPLKIYTIYSTPLHPHGQVEHVKEPEM